MLEMDDVSWASKVSRWAVEQLGSDRASFFLSPVLFVAEASGKLPSCFCISSASTNPQPGIPEALGVQRRQPKP